MFERLKLAVKLPFAVLYDSVTFCSCGQYSATEDAVNTYRKAQQEKEIDECIKVIKAIQKLKR